MKVPIKRSKEILIYLSGFYSNRMLTILLVPGLIGGIWLIFLREFSIVFLGIAFALSLRYVYKIANLPITKLTPLLIKDIQIKKKLWIVIIGFIVSFYDFFLLALWVIFIFEFFFSNSSSTLITPLIMWGYFITLGGIEYMSFKAENDRRFGISINFLYTQFLYFLVIGLWLFNINPFIYIFLVLLFFSGVTIREELILSKKEYKSES